MSLRARHGPPLVGLGHLDRNVVRVCLGETDATRGTDARSRRAQVTAISFWKQNRLTHAQK